jgi:hypothetical protein
MSCKLIIRLQVVALLFSLFGFVQAGVVLQERAVGLESFPCSECHDSLEAGVTETPLDGNHEELLPKHMKRISQCTLCHNESDSDQLKLLNGTMVSFDQSHLVCIQCHGEKGSDWKRGIHGKQIGSWNGTQTRLLCSDCHEAHAPKFKQFVADPPPVKPRTQH